MSGLVSGAGGTVLKDNFVGTNGTALTAHTMDVGPGWTQRTADVGMAIQSNTAQYADDALDIYTASCNYSDVTIRLGVNIFSAFTTSVQNGLVARFSDTNNYWRLTIQTSGVLALTETSGGTVTQRASASVTINTGTTYTLQLVASGSSMTGTLNGGNSINYASAASNQTVKNHGLYCNNTTKQTNFSNFLVTNP
jgi:pectate lyase